MSIYHVPDPLVRSSKVDAIDLVLQRRKWKFGKLGKWFRVTQQMVELNGEPWYFLSSEPLLFSCRAVDLIQLSLRLEA